MKKAIQRVGLLLVLTAACMCSFAQQKAAEKINLGDPMPALTLTSTTYGNVSAADLKGKVAVSYTHLRAHET